MLAKNYYYLLELVHELDALCLRIYYYTKQTKFLQSKTEIKMSLSTKTDVRPNRSVLWTEMIRCD